MGEVQKYNVGMDGEMYLWPNGEWISCADYDAALKAAQDENRALKEVYNQAERMLALVCTITTAKFSNPKMNGRAIIDEYQHDLVAAMMETRELIAARTAKEATKEAGSE